MSKIDSIERAGRLARTMASDVAIYNEAKIRKGLANDNLFEEMQGEIAEAERMWKDKVSEEIVNGTNIFHRAFVDQFFAAQRAEGASIF